MRYDLRAVVCKVGTATASGHFIAAIYRGFNKWTWIDDKELIELDQNSAASRSFFQYMEHTAYAVFFEKH